MQILEIATMCGQTCFIKSWSNTSLTHQNEKRKNEEITKAFSECFELVVNPIKLHESPSWPMDEIIDINRLSIKVTTNCC